VYPLAARRRGDQGTVLIRVLVTAEGLAASVGIDKSSGHPALDEAAFLMRPGELSGILESPMGLHLLRCDNVEPGGPVPLSRVRDRMGVLLRGWRSPISTQAKHQMSTAGLALDARGLAVDLDASLAARRLPQPDSQTHRVDLSRLVSRYIGETEKNLGAVFNDAPPGRALLEYDESASLFGKR